MDPARPARRVVAVVGPTGAGKTALAVRIAEAAGGEVVSADSQQVYRGMDIGTGKPSADERARVPHHLLDVLDPDETMTAARFVALADAAMADIRARGRHVILEGGTGLYYRALLYGLFEGPDADPAVRARLDAEPTEALVARLAVVDPAAAARIDPHDRLRTIRALEVHELTGTPMSEHQRRHGLRTREPRFACRAVALDPPRAELYAAIDRRVTEMIAAGWVEEARALLGRGTARPGGGLDALGYRDLFAHLRGETTLEEAVRRIQQGTRRYARRQLSWFRSEPTVTWYKSAADVDVTALAAWLNGHGCD